ncbi:hypothetical protein CL176_08920 [Suicoccus acidiformans]|uniref:Nitroreductase domain-containing protein n=2 Tax=Suicoccus acidiformans TaxID=2036206 RepID=A0A347WM03_9LACT|nr:hypothetical protein CL176_08920 [Suicoccus acidiformans]
MGIDSSNVEKVSALLNLPELTYPLLGLGFGYTAQETALTPKPDLAFKVSENYYQSIKEKADSLEAFDKITYDRQVAKGYKNPKNYSQRIARQITKDPNSTPRAYFVDYLRQRGFDV